MRSVLLSALLFLAAAVQAAPSTYVDPLSFDGSDAQKAAVLSHIEKIVHKEYCEGLGQCSPTTLRVMEEEELRAFKALASRDIDRKLFGIVYKDFCVAIGDCAYSTLAMMYRMEQRASEKKLQW